MRVPIKAATVGALLAACTPVSEQRTGTRLVGSDAALAMPAPGGPAVIGVVERRFSNAMEQQIALETRAATTGQNSLGVRVLGLARATGDDALVPTVMTDAAIADEMLEAFPGVAMAISPAFVQNAYGPFGYAVGRGVGRDLCLYGWQRIEGEVTTPFVRQGAIETRLRICQAGASERTLLAGMYGYTVRAAFGPGWSTGSPVPALPAAIGAAGAPIYPASIEVAAEASGQAEPGRRASPRRLKKSGAPSSAPVATAATPAAAGPKVPGPAAPAAATPTVPPPAAPVPMLSAGASPSLAPIAAAGSRTPRVPAPPTRVDLSGLSGATQ